ncbi:MAG: tetratricopeptide repeat protein [Bacteroidales bacterium]|nr:tetratricopeptide repeat protein [Bacteroidales bacterium]
MAKQEIKQTRTTVDDVNEKLTSMEQRLENNKKLIYGGVAAIIAVFAIVAIFIVVRNNGMKDAQNMVNKADMEYMMQGDSAGLVAYKKAANESYAPASRAAQMAATILYKQKKYDEAIQMLEGSSFNGKIMGPAALSLLADCYVNKKNYDKALSNFDKAIKAAGDNESLTPVFMKKKATVLHATKKYDEELAVYEDMKQKFPNYALGINIDKYIERAKASK